MSRNHIVSSSISHPVVQHESGKFSFMGHSCSPWLKQVVFASWYVLASLQGVGEIQVDPESSQHLTACLSFSA